MKTFDAINSIVYVAADYMEPYENCIIKADYEEIMSLGSMRGIHTWTIREFPMASQVVFRALPLLSVIVFESNQPLDRGFLDQEINIDQEEISVILRFMTPLEAFSGLFRLEWSDESINQCVIGGIRHGAAQEKG
jgi:hypothetical protein